MKRPGAVVAIKNKDKAKKQLWKFIFLTSQWSKENEGKKLEECKPTKHRSKIEKHKIQWSVQILNISYFKKVNRTATFVQR